MQWLVVLETDHDFISVCRLANIFRRKGLKIVTLTMASRPEGFHLLALVESAEGEVEHIFNFLRRTEGVRQVTYYRHEASDEESYVFVDEDTDKSSVARILQAFPEAKLIFADRGRYLLKVPADSSSRWASLGLDRPEFLPFARVRTTRSVTPPELVAAQAS